MLKCSVMSQTQSNPITKLIRDIGPEQHTYTTPRARFSADVSGILVIVERSPQSGQQANPLLSHHASPRASAQ